MRLNFGTAMQFLKVSALILLLTVCLPAFATEMFLDQSQSQMEIVITDQLAAGRQMVDVEMLPLTDGSGTVLFGATFKPMSGTIHYVLAADTTAWTDFLNLVDGLTGRFLDFEIELIDGVITRCGIFWEGGGEDYAAQISTTNSESDFQTQLSTAQDAGLTIIDFEAFKDNTGLLRYGGIWIDGAVQPRTQLLYGLTWNEVVDLLEPLHGRVVDLERYFDDQSRLRWGVILAMYPGGGSQVVQELTEAALVSFDAGHPENLIDLDSYEFVPGDVHYTGVWGDDWKSLREVDPVVPSTAVDPGSDIQSIITAFEANGAGEMGLFGRNVRIGKSVEYRADEPFYLASSAKLAMHVRLWQLHQQGDLDINTDTLWYSTDPNTAIPWFVDERPDCGGSIGECGLSTGACGDGDDRNIAIPLSTLDRGMMRVSDNAATSILVDDPTLGLAFADTDLNEWVSSLAGVSRGFGVLSSIQDLDRVIAWQGQWPNTNNDPSYFSAPRAGLETATRGGSLGYRECQVDSDSSWTGTPCGCTLGGTPQTGCPTGQTCTRRQDPWGDLTNYLLSKDPNWPTGTFPVTSSTTGNARYYNTGLNFATPRAFGELQEQFVAGELLDGPTTESALGVMLQSGQPLDQFGIPAHIDGYSKGGSKGGTSAPCSDTTIFRVGPDAVVVNVMTEDNLVNPVPNQRTCAQVRAFWRAPPTTSGIPLGQAVVQRLLADLRTADPQVVGFSPTSIRPGQTFEAVVDVTNSGGVETSPFDVTFYATSDGWLGDLDADDLPIGATQVASIAAGETLRVKFSGAFPSSIPEGTYDLGWYIDAPDSLPFGDVGEWTEGSEQHGVLTNSVLTVLPPAPPCVDADLDGYVECTPDCDPAGMSCGDCDDANEFVSPLGVDVCNQLDDDCDGIPDPGALRPATIRSVVDLDNPETSDEFGTVIARLGDLDGDGVDEYAVGQPNADSPASADAGAVHIFSGATGLLYCEIFDPSGGSSDKFGASIAGLQDVTGDPIPDLIVGAPGYDGVANNTGAALVFDGATCSASVRFQPSTAETGEAYGTVVAGVGDVNLDGAEDVAIGAPNYDGSDSNRGRVEIRAIHSQVLIRTLFDPNAQNGDMFGEAIIGIDDLDGDLVPDIVVGAHNRDGARGAVIVFSGSTGEAFATWTLPGAAAGDSFGFSLAPLGDVTGDSIPDLAVGTINGDTLAGSNSGEAQILSGADGTVFHTLYDLSGGPSDDFGYAVAGAGDIDGDGFEDVAVGAPLHDGSAGTDAGSVVVFSGASGAVLLDLEDPESRAGERLGWSVVRLGDLTGDRLPEFAAGAPRADVVEASRAGRVIIWSLEADCDDDGFTPFDGDCDDQDATTFTGAPELCDAADNDCDMAVDEDNDGDTYAVCDECDDTDARIYPGAPERCNSLDDDCDFDVDEGVDVDLDGYTDTCDCNDGNNAIHPGATDSTCDRIDQDCNGVTDDGFGTPAGERLLLRVPEHSSDEFGTSVAVVGDWTGDGLPEIAVGVPRDDTIAFGAGAVEVFDGASGDLHCTLTDPDGAYTDNLGESIAALGDMNDDGVPDVLAGSEGDDDPLSGAGSLVVFSGIDCTVLYKTFDPEGLSTASLGNVVAAIGDLDGDGKSEYVAAAPDSDDFGLTNTGRVVAFDGATGAVLYRVTNVNPVRNEQFGTSIAGGHDLNADGIPDFVVGTYQDDTRVGTNSGALLVVSGADGTPIRKLHDEDGGLSDHLGRSVALIEDLNGDAVADILGGAPGEDTGGSNAGAVIVFSGADGTRIGRATFNEPGTQEEMGWSVAAMPDIDGDDLPDFAAGAISDDDDGSGTNTGSVYLISGADLSLIQRVYRPVGQDNSDLGTSLAISPDLTGDGMPEIVAGAPLYDGTSGTSSGLVVVFALEADCDGDGVSPFGGDCDDGNGDAFGRPGDVELLVFDDKNNVSWQPPTEPGGTVAGLSYDTIESSDAADFSTTATCIESGDTDTTAFLPGTPGPGNSEYYLVRAGNACGIGPAGFDSPGTERPAQACP